LVGSKSKGTWGSWEGLKDWLARQLAKAYM
jgi:hypothetical protein